MTRSVIEDPRDIRNFIVSGRAVFTIVSKSSGTRFTYRVRKGEGVFFCSVLTSPDAYSYIGIIPAWGENELPQFNRYRATAKSKISETAPSQKAFRWLMGKLHKDLAGIQQAEFWHEGKCGRCSRPLTDPESILRGLGPTCAGK